ncbi:epoxyqueuosine reductase [Pelosinus sp. sgz500959]|uniref:epoxyqueuosine reductase n=1 Tax=Pelosinus sp. sgz500959 TaxID=3242472 RepID=UPI00366DD9BB
MMSNLEEIKQQIVEYAKGMGASLVGFAPLERWKESNEVHPSYHPDGIWSEAKTVIVLGVPILLPILETTPSINYVEQYDTSNVMLDQIAYRLAIYLNDLGHASIFLPRDGYGNIEILIDKPVAAFSHVYAGKYAGLGTIGYNNTLLNEKYGPRVRYVSVFTDLSLPGDSLVEKELCNGCRVCQKLCPSRAFTTRDNEVVAKMDKVACARYHADLKHENRYPCGICIKVCHVGKDRQLYKSNNIKLYLEEKEAIQKNPDDPRYRGWVHCRTHGSKGDRKF